jgi:hypothetical protein
MPKTHPSHKTRYSDSSIYDEVCEFCGGTDASGDMSLGSECPGDPNDPKYAHGMARDMMVDSQTHFSMVERFDKAPIDQNWYVDFNPFGQKCPEMTVGQLEAKIDDEITRLTDLKKQLQAFK